MANVDIVTLSGGKDQAHPALLGSAPAGQAGVSRISMPRGQMTEVRRSEEAAQKAVERTIERAREAGEGRYEMIRKNLRLAVFEPTGDLYAKIFNADTGELLKTIPPEALLKTWARMDEYVGRLLDERA